MESDLFVLTVLPFFGALGALLASRRILEGPQGTAARVESAGLVFLWTVAFGVVRYGVAVALALEVLGIDERVAACFAGFIVSYGLLVELLARGSRLSYGKAAFHAFVLAATHHVSRSIAYDLLLAL